jgi:hypothetical protein
MSEVNSFNVIPYSRAEQSILVFEKGRLNSIRQTGGLEVTNVLLM